MVQTDHSEDAPKLLSLTSAWGRIASMRARKPQRPQSVAVSAIALPHFTQKGIASIALLTAQRQAVLVPETANDDYHKVDQHLNTNAAECKDHQNVSNNYTDIKLVNAKSAEEKAQKSGRDHAVLRKRLHSRTIPRAAGWAI